VNQTLFWAKGALKSRSARVAAPGRPPCGQGHGSPVRGPPWPGPHRLLVQALEGAGRPPGARPTASSIPRAERPREGSFRSSYRGALHLLFNRPHPDSSSRRSPPKTSAWKTVRSRCPTCRQHGTGKSTSIIPMRCFSWIAGRDAHPSLERALQRAPLLTGRVVGPDGEPAAGATMIHGQAPFAECAHGPFARHYQGRDGPVFAVPSATSTRRCASPSSTREAAGRLRGRQRALRPVAPRRPITGSGGRLAGGARLAQRLKAPCRKPARQTLQVPGPEIGSAGTDSQSNGRYRPGASPRRPGTAVAERRGPRRTVTGPPRLSGGVIFAKAPCCFSASKKARHSGASRLRTGTRNGRPAPGSDGRRAVRTLRATALPVDHRAPAAGSPSGPTTRPVRRGARCRATFKRGVRVPAGRSRRSTSSG